MRKLFVLAMCLTGVLSDGVAATVRRGGTAAADTAQKATTSSATTARAARRTTMAAPASTGNTVAARSAVRSSSVAATPTVAARSATVAARAATKQKVIGTGTKVASAAKNVVVSEECQQKYEGCMDAFCMLDNETGGRCICSDKNAEFDSILAEIEKLDQQSYQMATTGVERIEMGADADAVIAAANAVANSITTDQKSATRRQSLDLSMWNTAIDIDDADSIFGDESDLMNQVDGKEGDALHSAATNICVAQIPECAADIEMLKMMYAQRVRSDCAAYENSLKQQKNASATKLAAAEKALREAALEQYRNANKYDLGQCTIQFKSCMQTTAGCGADFSACASVAAMNNTRAGATAAKAYKIKGASASIEISASTYDTLIAKKPLCETVTKSCVAVADQVWDTFLKEVAPQIKSAELIAEDNARQSCIGNIASCFQKACKDNIDPNDPDGSYDMCLTRPDTMLNVCKIPLNNCGISEKNATEDPIWGYVTARLASMRVDSCTTAVKECLQSEDRCGEDYTQCIGLDFNVISDMCPLEKLVGCQEDGKLDQMEDIDDIIRGIYLNIDNAMLTKCQNAVTDKMVEICGAENSCTAFEDDKIIGTESLISYKNNDGDFVIDGLVSFSNVKLAKDDSKDTSGFNIGYSVDIANYLSRLEADNTELTRCVDKYHSIEEQTSDDKIEFNQCVANAASSSAGTARVLGALESVASKIEQKIAILRNDPTINMCVTGRDMTKVTRNGAASTGGRFPYLLNSAVLTISADALNQAKNNYQKKYEELLQAALAESDAQVKSVLCASLASNTSAPICKTWAAVDGEAVCTEYTANSTLVENVFTSSADSKLGLQGDGLYSTSYTIAGAKMSDLAKVQSSGRSEYVQTDESGAMMGRITMSATYSASTNTCTLTTVSTMCKSAEKVVTTDVEETCGGGGVEVAGGYGCNGGGGLVTIGGRKSTTVTVENYQGMSCTEFGDPVTTVEKIKM